MNIKELTLAERSNYYSSAEFETAYSYHGSDLGVGYTKDKTTFRLWAPLATKVTLNLYSEGDTTKQDLLKALSMAPAENGTWYLELSVDLNCTYYTYSVMVNEEIIECVDPYARAVGVNGDRGLILNLKDTDPANWDCDTRITPVSETDAVIYEAHIRDISMDPHSGIKQKGKFLGLTETGTKNSYHECTGIDHLVELGITHLQILPFYDYATVDESNLKELQFNWGYDPKNYNCLEGSYSEDPFHGEVRIKECKEMIQALHDHGIGVIMDVVYNHTFDTSFCMNQITPGYFHRNTSDGSLSDGSGCGNDTASERSMVHKYIVDSVIYLAKEFHLDGFRFDLMGLLDVDTMNAIEQELHSIDPNIMIYGEGWSLNTTLTKSDAKLAVQTNASLMPKIGFFNDDIRDNVKGSVFELYEKGYINGASNLTNKIKQNVSADNEWSSDPKQSINYCSCHDNYTLWDKIQSCAKDDTKENQIRQNLLAAAIIFTSQGVPFIHAGEEILRSKLDSNGQFVENSYISPDSVNMIQWDNKHNYHTVFDYYKGLIAFRKAHPALRLQTEKEVQQKLHFLDHLPDNVIAYTIDGSSVKGETAEELMVIYNPNHNAATVPLPSGTWNICIQDTNASTTPLNDAKTAFIEIPLISCMVLIKSSNSAKKEDDSPVLTSHEVKKDPQSKKWLILSAISIIFAFFAAIIYFILNKRD